MSLREFGGGASRGRLPDGVAGTGEGVEEWHLSRRIRPSPCVSSCANFPVRARQSRFVPFWGFVA